LQINAREMRRRATRVIPSPSGQPPDALPRVNPAGRRDGFPPNAEGNALRTARKRKHNPFGDPIMSVEKDLAAINSSLQEVGGDLRAAKKQLDQHLEERAEISARLQAIEQTVVKHGYGEGTAALINSVGAEALDSLRES